MKHIPKRVLFTLIALPVFVGFLAQVIYDIWFRGESDHVSWKFWQ